MNNPSFYISIISSCAFIISEILPLLPIKQNGVVHSILVFIQNQNKNVITVNNKDIEIIKNNLTDITKRLDNLEII